MTEETTTNPDKFDYLVWISDIHLKSDDDTSKKLKEVLDDLTLKFSRYIKEKLKSTSRRIIFLISGDLAFSGKPIEYKDLKERLLKMIPQELLPRCLILPCGGNHDARWDELIANYYRNNDNLTEIFKNRNIHFNNVDDFDFDKVFEAYSNEFAFRHNRSCNLLKINDNNDLQISKRYEYSALEGFVIDHQLKTIVVVINSAWFSLGGSVRLFLQSIKENDKEDIIEIMEYAREAGHLITGINSENSRFEFEETLNILTDPKHTDYLKVTMTHYPLSFLDPEEVHSYQKNLQNEGVKLTQILKNSTILLSGHTHPSSIQRVEHLRDLNLMHFHAPMFLNHYGEKETDPDKVLPCNGFAIIKINRLKREYQVDYIDVSYDTMEKVRIRQRAYQPIDQITKVTSQFSEAPVYSIQSEFEKEPIKDAVLTTFPPAMEKISNEWKRIETTSFYIYLVKNNDNCTVFVLPKTINHAIEFISRDKTDYSNVKEFIDFINNNKLSQDIKFKGITFGIPEPFLIEFMDSPEYMIISNDCSTLEEIVDKGMNRFRISLYNLLDNEIENRNIIETFKALELTRFDSLIFSKRWFLS